MCPAHRKEKTRGDKHGRAVEEKTKNTGRQAQGGPIETGFGCGKKKGERGNSRPVRKIGRGKKGGATEKH